MATKLLSKLNSHEEGQQTHSVASEAVIRSVSSLYRFQGSVTKEDSWGFSSVGRAPALHAGCQEFESPILHHLNRADKALF